MTIGLIEILHKFPNTYYCRIESVKLKQATGIAKVFGIVLCLVGVLVLAFYEGPHLKSIRHDRPILHPSNGKKGSHSKSEWIIGTFVMILSAVTWSLWIILQVSRSQKLSHSVSSIINQNLISFSQTSNRKKEIYLSWKYVGRWQVWIFCTTIQVTYCGSHTPSIKKHQAQSLLKKMCCSSIDLMRSLLFRWYRIFRLSEFAGIFWCRYSIIVALTPLLIVSF